MISFFRFHATTTERQWRDIGFCLSIFNYNDKAAKKFIDSFNCYADKLHEDNLYEAVLSILTQCRKLPKQETKLAVEEIGNKVEEARNKAVEDHTAGTRAKKAHGVKAQPGGKKSGNGKPGKTPKRPTRSKTIDSSSDDEDNNEALDNKDLEPRRRSTRKNKNTPNQIPQSDSDNEADNDDTEDDNEEDELKKKPEDKLVKELKQRETESSSGDESGHFVKTKKVGKAKLAHEEEQDENKDKNNTSGNGSPEESSRKRSRRGRKESVERTEKPVESPVKSARSTRTRRAR